jgi:hypothetical protein
MLMIARRTPKSARANPAPPPGGWQMSTTSARIAARSPPPCPKGLWFDRGLNWLQDTTIYTKLTGENPKEVVRVFDHASAPVELASNTVVTRPGRIESPLGGEG